MRQMGKPEKKEVVGLNLLDLENAKLIQRRKGYNQACDDWEEYLSAKPKTEKELQIKLQKCVENNSNLADKVIELGGTINGGGV